MLVSFHELIRQQDDTLYRFESRLDRNRHVLLIEPLKMKKPARELKAVEKKKTILYWTKMFTSNNFYFGDGDIFDGCPVSACVATNDREYQSVEEFDAVMFHGPELSEKDLPMTRSPHQRYIFMDSETQVFHPIPDKSVFNYFFNWTMAYRRDADIMRPYGIFTNITSNQVIPPYIPAQWVNVSDAVIPESTRLLFKNKTKMAAWFVSHCNTQSKREEVASRLQDYVKVDIYGDCGSFKCPRTVETECYKTLESEYFFYLSFENSLCRDYITEKVYKALEYDVIPIVYGAADYDSFLPPNSYINVMDFPSIQVLAEFLVELSNDEERYLTYFKWKNFYKVVTTKDYIICEFCKALHEPYSPNQVVGNIFEWWAGGSMCQPPPKIS